MVSKNFSLQHLIRESTVSSNAPALILLHGYGSDENDLFSFANELPKELFIISAKAPFALPPPYGNAWYAINFDTNENKFSDNNQARESRDKILEFIEEVKVNYPVDPNNINLLGFSQGSILSYAVALSHPEKIKNVVALSGYINFDILEEGYEKNDFSKLSIYASHGSQDPVIPVAWARKIPEILTKLGIDHKYSEFPVGHGVAPQNLFELKNFLKRVIFKEES